MNSIAVPDAVAGIDQNGDAERQVSLGSELEDVLRAPVFEYLEVAAGQVGHETAFLVGDREQQVHSGDVQDDAGLDVVFDPALRGGRLLRGPLRRQPKSERAGHKDCATQRIHSSPS